MLCGLEIAGVVEQQPGRRFRQDLTGLDSVQISRGAPLLPRPLLRPALQLLRFRHRRAARRALRMPMSHAVLREWARLAGATRAGSSPGVWRRSTSAAARRPGSTRARIAAHPRAHRGRPAGRAPAPRSRSRPTPTTSPRDAAAAWRAAGVNRVSLGVQSFDPARARAGCTAPTPRSRSAAAVEALRNAGIAELSLDLIFGLPAALGRDWARRPGAGARARAGAPLALRPDRRGAHAARPGGPRGARSRRWTRTATPRSSCEADAVLGAGGVPALRGLQLRPSRSPGPAQQRLLAAGAVHRARARRPTAAWGGERQWNLREWAAYERADGRRAESGSRAPSGWTTRPSSWRSSTRASGPVRGVPAERLPPEIAAAWVARRLGLALRRPGSALARGLAPARRPGAAAV